MSARAEVARAEVAWDIRPLALDDCDELGQVHVAVWRDTYAGIMSDDYLATLSSERSAVRWRQRFEQPESVPAGSSTLVARDADGALVGFVSTGPSRDEDAPTEWELYAINLLRRVHGTGLAQELVRRGLGDRDATLWVVEENALARRFYERLGFVDEGGRSEHDATGTREIRLVRRRV